MERSLLFSITFLTRVETVLMTLYIPLKTKDRPVTVWNETQGFTTGTVCVLYRYICLNEEVMISRD